MGAIEMLTKLATVGELTIEKVTEAAMSQVASAMEGAAKTAEGIGGKAAEADKTLAYILDKATPGMGQQKTNEQAKSTDKGDFGIGM